MAPISRCPHHRAAACTDATVHPLRGHHIANCYMSGSVRSPGRRSRAVQSGCPSLALNAPTTWGLGRRRFAFTCQGGRHPIAACIPPPRQHRESKGIEPRSMSRLSLAFASGHVCLFGQITQKREKCWRLPNKKSHGRQEFESGRRRSCSLRRTNNGAHRQSPAQEHGWFRHDQVRLEILSAKRRGIEARKYKC